MKCIKMCIQHLRRHAIHYQLHWDTRALGKNSSKLAQKSQTLAKCHLQAREKQAPTSWVEQLPWKQNGLCVHFPGKKNRAIQSSGILFDAARFRSMSYFLQEVKFSLEIDHNVVALQLN